MVDHPSNLQPSVFDWVEEVEQVSAINLNMVQINKLHSFDSSKKGKGKLHQLSGDLARVPDDRGLTTFSDLSKRWNMIKDYMHKNNDNSCSHILDQPQNKHKQALPVSHDYKDFNKEFSTNEIFISQVLEEAQTLNKLLEKYNIRENIPIKGKIPLFIPITNVNRDKLKDISWDFEEVKDFFIFHLTFIYDSGCDLAVVRDSFCEVLKDFSFEERVISVPNQKPTKFKLPVVRAAVPNIGYINFLGLRELPSYKNQGGTTCIIQNLMNLDSKTAKQLNLDRIEQGSQIDILLPNTLKIVHYLEMEDI
jgi:hypothetical protein